MLSADGKYNIKFVIRYPRNKPAVQIAYVKFGNFECAGMAPVSNTLTPHATFESRATTTISETTNLEADYENQLLTLWYDSLDDKDR